MAKYNEQEPIPASVNRIAPGTVIKGEININGDIRVEGTINGIVKSKGRLIIGDTGNVEGDISCQNAEIQGIVNGKLTVTEITTLKSTANFIGDIITNKIAIEPGAKFSGTCNMKADPKKEDIKEIKNVSEKTITEGYKNANS